MKVLKLWLIFSLFFSLFFTLSVANAAERFGTVRWLTGTVEISTPNGTTRIAQKNQTIFVGETLITDGRSEIHVLSDDNALLAVRPNSQVLIETYSAKQKPDDKFVLRLVKGTFRAVSGWIGRMNRDNYRINTPIATIGIRGTDHEPYLIANGRDAGVYDKVNRGMTTLQRNETTLARDIPAGKVGVVVAERSMALLLPRLLNDVPGFYLPGANEADIDAFSAQAALQENPNTPLPSCLDQKTAENFLTQFDLAVQTGNELWLKSAFLPNATIIANVRSGTEWVTQTYSVQDYLQSAMDAFKQLQNYQAKREDIRFNTPDNQSCRSGQIDNHLVESGQFGRQTFRLVSKQTVTLQPINEFANQWAILKLELVQE